MGTDAYIKSCWVLFKHIYNDEIVLNTVKEELLDGAKKALKYSNLLLEGKWQKLKGQSPLVILTALVLCLRKTYDRYRRMGLSESVFFDTMSDIKIWGEDYRAHNNGEVGLTEINWLHLHVNCEIFKFGRLQYQIGRFYFAKSYEMAENTVRFGEKCYFIHIPRGAKLDSVSCKKSITLAVDTLEDIFKDIPTDFMACHSWLLSTKNANFVAPTSNIAKFAKMFKLVGESEDASGHLRFVFDIEEDNKLLMKNKRKFGYYYNLTNYEAKTSLQTATKEYIMNGGELTSGKGVIETKYIIG